MGPDGIRWSLDRWAEALTARYYSPTFAGEPVTFCVDTDELESIRGLPPTQALEELAAAVANVVMPGYNFRSVWMRCRDWQSRGCLGPPPSLPLLALAVVAAGRMEVKQQGAPNYYRPFRKLLDPGDPLGGVPGDYGQILPLMWEQLSWWLDVHLSGKRGLSTITRHAHFTNIGYALQQAILRASDRRRIHRFFRSVGFEPGDDVVPEQLRRALEIWSRRLGPSGERLHRLASDPALEPYTDDLLRRIAHQWDGSIRDPRTGVAALPIRVLIEDRPFRIGLTLLRSDDDPTTLQLVTGEVQLEINSAGPYFTPIPLPLELADVLRLGVEFSGPLAAAVFDPAPAYPLSYNDDVAGWVSTDRISFGEPHLLLIEKGEWSNLREWIEREGISGNIDPKATPMLPDGWFLIRGFGLDHRPREKPPRAIADLLGATGGSHTRLVGGLKIHGLPRTFLMGGLPFLTIPSDEEQVEFELTTEGYDPVQFKASDGEFPLNAVNLGPGAYLVSHNLGAIEFDIVDGLSQQPDPTVGRACQTGRDGRTVAGLIASVPSPTEPRSVPVSDEGTYAVLGPCPGDIALVEVPYWLCKLLGTLSWTASDLWCDFEPVWLISEGSEPEAQLLSVVEPTPGPENATWNNLILRTSFDSPHPEEQDLWSRYKAIAQGKAADELDR